MGYGIKRRLPVLLLLAFLFLLPLTACGDEDSGTQVIFTTGMGKDEVFRIGSSVCTAPEMMVYLTNTQNQYESVYGPDVWNVSRDGITLEENVKETVLAKMAQIKTMYLLAQDRGVALDDSENKKVGQAAEEYFDSLTDQEKELMGVKVSTVEQLYREYALADKVYRYIIQDVNPEISDDEARTITIQQILIKTGTADGSENQAADSGTVRQEAYEKALDIRRMAVEEGEDFLDLASRYSEDSVITNSFGKGEMDSAFEEAAFSLETGEVSQVIETEAGYYIIKCISTFDREQTDLNKQTIVEERRREVFGQEYNAFVEALPRQLNQELWENMKLLHDEGVTTAGFFDTYAKYFPG
ncbi:MAG TPA: peptidylprolyl isomerase [Lachnospiraceae bacterium]|nr:peptidylprolyl isomerase [Lachnospiraceae bacterium]